MSCQKALTPARQRELVQYLAVGYGVSQRRACQVLRAGRSTVRYQSIADDRADLLVRLKDVAASRPRYGYRRLHLLLERQGVQANHKLVYRLYREEGLGIRSKRPKRRKSCQVRAERVTVAQINDCWSMDFMSEQLLGGQRFRLLTLVDNFSRESLAIRVGQRLTGDDVVRFLDEVMQRRGKPKRIQTDNGPEFVSKSLDCWAYWNGVKLDFSRPGKPTDNPSIESFNGRLREECLNQHWFLSLQESQCTVEAWREDYNRHRPHSAQGDRTPVEFAIFSAGARPC